MSLEKDVRFSEKKVDESWKEDALKETRQPTPSTPPKAATDKSSPRDDLGADDEATSPFVQLVSSLGMQALIHLGDLKDPSSDIVRKDFGAAKATIDLLAALQEKTEGNLNEQEARLLNSLIYDLQMRFVERHKASR